MPKPSRRLKQPKTSKEFKQWLSAPAASIAPARWDQANFDNSPPTLPLPPGQGLLRNRRQDLIEEGRIRPATSRLGLASVHTSPKEYA